MSEKFICYRQMCEFLVDDLNSLPEGVFEKVKEKKMVLVSS